jgi:hypothetical protein
MGAPEIIGPANGTVSQIGVSPWEYEYKMHVFGWMSLSPTQNYLGHWECGPLPCADSTLRDPDNFGTAVLEGQPSISVWNNPRTDLFITAPAADKRTLLFHGYLDGTWNPAGGFELIGPISSSLRGGPVAISRASRMYIDIFAVDTDQNLVHWSWDPDGWGQKSPSQPDGGKLPRDPEILMDGIFGGQFSVALYGREGQPPAAPQPSTPAPPAQDPCAPNPIACIRLTTFPANPQPGAAGGCYTYNRIINVSNRNISVTLSYRIMKGVIFQEDLPNKTVVIPPGPTDAACKYSSDQI